MSEVELLRGRLEATERRVRVLGAVAVLLGATVLIGALQPQADVLHARGLVITDAAGRERIVLGAPMREASADGKLAQATGLAVLDSVGRLQVALGADNPLVLASGQLGTRITSNAGLTVYDPRNGSERGGISAFSDGRANVCLDYGTGSKEAACMSVAPGDKYAAVILNGTPGEPQFDRVTMYVGADGAGSIKAFGGGANNGGVMIRAGKGPATITVYDTTGKAIGDIAKRP
jgi:hypothetical protein